jgi:hypothetical protein
MTPAGTTAVNRSGMTGSGVATKSFTETARGTPPGTFGSAVRFVP